MGKSKTTKIIRAGTAIMLAGALCGCTIKLNTKKEPKLEAVVAYSQTGAEELKITYEAFSKEYKYYLVNSGITDDTLESVADTCKAQREKVINYLIDEQIILQKAKDMGVYELTEEEQKAVDDDFAEKIKAQVDYFGSQAEKEAEQQTSAEQSENQDDEHADVKAESTEESDGESTSESADESASSETASSGTGEDTSGTESTPILSDEEKESLGNDMLDDMLEKCGMTRDDLYEWAKNSKIVEKVREKLGENVTREDAQKEFENFEMQAEETYKNDIESYQQQGYSDIWLPENSRLIKHILLGFDNDTSQQIEDLRKDGKDDEADKLRTEKAEELKSKREEAEKKLDDGENLDDLIKEYSTDATGSMMNPDGYTVIPNGTQYMPEFQEAAFVPEKIGDRTTCVTDYGVHIIVYAGDAQISEKSINSYVDYMLEQLKLREYADKLEEWDKEYVFEIDYKTLRIDDPAKENSAAESGSSAADSTAESAAPSETDSDAENSKNSE